jgi:hypothetical protein
MGHNDVVAVKELAAIAAQHQGTSEHLVINLGLQNPR